MIHKRILLFIISFAVCMGLSTSNPLYAEVAGASFLKIPPGARAAGMGNAFMAIADDAAGLWFNPAGSSAMSHREFMGTHAEWLAGTRFNHASYINPLARGAVSASVSLLEYGSIESRNEAGSKTGSFTAQDMCVSGGYARALTTRLSLGVNIKYIEQRIGSAQAQGYACDIGSHYTLPLKNLYAGFGIFNIGPSMKYHSESYSLPLQYAGGLGYRYGELMICGDIRYNAVNGKTEVAFGSEYTVHSILALRLGYLHNQIAATLNQNHDYSGIAGLSGFQGGFGLCIFNNQMDYALVPYG
ncbi:MAG: PorV/PorQ family protein, partial [Elusimicrobia bacterium]|nr:PorV/PorQ family protein [Elusimicrobiota bacterium]MBD3412777.1 PorV/PorQ family protein [Elusimicrobiota bacterium]